MSDTLSRRREFLFLYDIRMGNPNGDPDENRPRRLPDGTFYVTDVRLKRFARDWLKTQGEAILVDRPEDAATNLTGRVQHLLRDKPERVRPECEEYEKLLKAAEAKKPKAKKKAKEDAAAQEEEAAPAEETEEADAKAPAAQAGWLVVDIILKAFIDARLFGSSLAFKDWAVAGKNIAPRPKTLTGAVQINMGEVLHRAQEIDIAGTSLFASDETKAQGTFTSYHGLRYGLIGFNGIANEHSARLSRLSDADYERLLTALWKGVASAPTANTRTKTGQVPRLLVDITYKETSEFQFGCLLNYVKVVPREGLPSEHMASPGDYRLELSRLVERLGHDNVQKVRYAAHPDLNIDPVSVSWQAMDLDVRPNHVVGG